MNFGRFSHFTVKSWEFASKFGELSLGERVKMERKVPFPSLSRPSPGG